MFFSFAVTHCNLHTFWFLLAVTQCPCSLHSFWILQFCSNSLQSALIQDSSVLSVTHCNPHSFWVLLAVTQCPCILFFFRAVTASSLHSFWVLRAVTASSLQGILVSSCSNSLYLNLQTCFFFLSCIKTLQPATHQWLRLVSSYPLVIYTLSRFFLP